MGGEHLLTLTNNWNGKENLMLYVFRLVVANKMDMLKNVVITGHRLHKLQRFLSFNFY